MYFVAVEQMPKGSNKITWKTRIASKSQEVIMPKKVGQNFCTRVLFSHNVIFELLFPLPPTSKPYRMFADARLRGSQLRQSSTIVFSPPRFEPRRRDRLDCRNCLGMKKNAGKRKIMVGFSGGCGQEAGDDDGRGSSVSAIFSTDNSSSCIAAADQHPACPEDSAESQRLERLLAVLVEYLVSRQRNWGTDGRSDPDLAPSSF